MTSKKLSASMAKTIALPGIPITPAHANCPVEGGIVSRRVDFATVFANLHPDEHAALLEQLVTIAARVMRKHGSIARHYARDPEDFVHDAIIKAYVGERAWPEQITMQQFLGGIIASDISHSGTRAEHTRRHAANTGNGEGESDPRETIESLPSDEDVAATAIANVDTSRFIARCPADLREYIHVRLDAVGSTAEELARKINKPVNEIRNLDRKLVRRKRAQWNSR